MTRLDFGERQPHSPFRPAGLSGKAACKRAYWRLVALVVLVSGCLSGPPDEPKSREAATDEGLYLAEIPLGTSVLVVDLIQSTRVDWILRHGNDAIQSGPSLDEWADQNGFYEGQFLAVALPGAPTSQAPKRIPSTSLLGAPQILEPTGTRRPTLPLFTEQDLPTILPAGRHTLFAATNVAGFTIELAIGEPAPEPPRTMAFVQASTPVLLWPEAVEQNTMAVDQAPATFHRWEWDGNLSLGPSLLLGHFWLLDANESAIHRHDFSQAAPTFFEGDAPPPSFETVATGIGPSYHHVTGGTFVSKGGELRFSAAFETMVVGLRPTVGIGLILIEINVN